MEVINMSMYIIYLYFNFNIKKILIVDLSILINGFRRISMNIEKNV